MCISVWDYFKNITIWIKRILDENMKNEDKFVY